MRILTTAILGVTSVALAVTIHLVDREPVTGEGAAEQANVLIRFEPEKVDRIVVERGPSKTVIERRDSFWYFTEPEQDRVDAGAVATLLDELNHLSVVDTIARGEGGMEPQELGVRGDDAVKVTVSGPSGKGGKERFKEGVVLGLAAPRANSIYARRVEDEGNTLVVNGNPRRWIEQPLGTMRDRRVLGAPVEAIVQLVIRRSTGQVSLQRRVTPPVQDWALTAPISTWASKEEMDRLMADLAGLRIEEVVSGTDGAEEIPNPLPEEAAVLQMQVFGIEQPLVVYLKQVEPAEIEGAMPLIEARVTGRPSAYRFRSSILDTLPETANDIRDRTLARIPMAYLDKVYIQSRIDPLVYLESEIMPEGVRWDVRLNNKLVPANIAEISNLVAGINETRILDFASDTGENLAGYGLQPPARRVTFALRYPGQPDEQGNPGPPQEVNRVLNLGWKDGDEQRLFANFDGEPFIYELDPGFVGMIPTHPIKWRSLNVLNFNPFHLVSITREEPGVELLKLEYKYRFDKWEAHRNGVDVTRNLDISSARRLRDRLGALTVDGWYLSLGQAYEALENPRATFTIVTSELDRATGDKRTVTQKIRFAASPAENVYFGQVEGSPDVFYLKSDKFGDLLRPVTSGRGQ